MNRETLNRLAAARLDEVFAALGVRRCRKLRAWCPLCQNDGKPHRDPDFGIRGDLLGWKCHRCQASGDWVALVEKKMNMVWPLSGRWLAEQLRLGGVTFGLYRAAVPSSPEPNGKAVVEAATLRELCRTMERIFTKKYGQPFVTSAVWMYTPSVAQIRFDGADDKAYTPAVLSNGRWAVKGPDRPWPLYRVWEAIRHARQGTGITGTADGAEHVDVPAVSVPALPFGRHFRFGWQETGYYVGTHCPGSEVVAAAYRGKAEVRFVRGCRFRAADGSEIPSDAIVVVEGEKCADILRVIGLPATCGFGGAGGFAKCDWAPLAGHDIVVIADNDEAGRKYAMGVVDQCRKSGAASASAYVLKKRPGGYDVADWAAERVSKGQDLSWGSLCLELYPVE